MVTSQVDSHSSPHARARNRRTAAWACALLAASGCSKGPAYGSDNALIAVLDPAVREAVEPILRAAFEREVFTTRNEPVFEVTVTTPEAIGEFRKWKRLLVVEPADGATLLPELAGDAEPPVVREVDDRWARDQTIWAVGGATPEATIELVRAVADSLYDVAHGRFVDHHVERMWASEPDSALAGRLADSLGFSIVLPRVYHPAPGSAPADSRVWFNGDPRRIVALHWVPRPAAIDADTVLALRRAWGRELYPDDTLAVPGAADSVANAPLDGDEAATESAGPERLLVDEVELDGRPAVRIQGVWRDRAIPPSAGVFVTYGVGCGERLVLLDGNLYAPDRDKYPYLIQLDRIFATFRCHAAEPSR